MKKNKIEINLSNELLKKLLMVIGTLAFALGCISCNKDNVQKQIKEKICNERQH